MFLSKIWFFVIALLAAVALTVALVMPRPAQRRFVKEEQDRLAIACGVIDILMTDDARNRVELAGTFARAPEIVSALESASAADKLDDARMKQVRETGEKIMAGISGRKPDFAMLIDRRGRVVARIKLDENDFGDYAAGRPLVDDAGHLQHPVGQRRLAVVDVGDDAEVPDQLRRRRGRLQRGAGQGGHGCFEPHEDVGRTDRPILPCARVCR